jgi:hypothetical protein
MKKLFRFLGWLLLVVLVLGGIGFAFYRHISTLSEEGRDYVQHTVPTIFSNWNAMQLYDRASPELKEVMTLDRVYDLFRQGSVLGRLEKCGAARGNAGVFFDFRRGKVTSALFATNAEFERGEAEITIGLIKHGDQWQIQSFNIQSPDVSRLSGNQFAADLKPQQPVSPAPPKPPQPASVNEAQREAVRRYPDIGVAGSRLNIEFVARHKRYQKEHPEYFRDPSWPLRLAEESARAIAGR